jgi:hypothetical protein
MFAYNLFLCLILFFLSLLEIYEDNRIEERKLLVNEKFIKVNTLEAYPLKTNNPGDDFEEVFLDI